MAEGGAAGVETQRGEVAALLKTPLRKGDTWYLVDSRWFKQWKKYVGYDSWDKYQMGDQNVYPGPVDNAGLLRDGDVLAIKEHLIDELDYILIPTEGWNKLLSWYGLKDNQEPISRKVVEQGMFVKHSKVEVYLTELKLCEDGNMEKVVTRPFSKADRIETIEKEMRKLFSISEAKETRLWNRYMSNTFEPLNKPESTIQDAGLYQGQILVIEQKNEDGSWPRGSTSSKSSGSSNLAALPKISPSSLTNNHSSSFNGRNAKNSSYSLSSYQPYTNSYDNSDQGRQGTRPGLCGLSNLGNTCFMNSAVQCLSNIPPLTQYFLKNKYTEELNEDNPLGMKGEIARVYAELIKQGWSGKFSYVTPRPFKTQVGRFAPQFSGYQQQDSHELLAFLLDGLHEDLNRIREKPYIPLKDANGRPDQVVAEEAWESHVRRNDSIIVDIFHGLFKSTLVCPVCAKVSVTFDPFCYLTLPLPMKKERTLEVYLVRVDPLLKPTQVRASRRCPRVTDAGVLTTVHWTSMIVTDIYNHRFHRIFATNENLSSIMERDDIYVFELAVNRQEDSDHVVFPVHLREKFKQSGYNHASMPLFGQPFLITVCREEVHLQLTAVASLWGPRCSVPIGVRPISARSSPGEMETDEQDEESSQDQELPSENDNSQSEDSVGGDNELENGVVGPESSIKPQQTPGRHKTSLFSIQFNNMGKTDFAVLKDGTRQICFDDGHIRLSDRSYLSLDWEPDMKKKYFDDRAAEDFEKHESMDYKPQKKAFFKLKDCIELFTTKEKLGAEDPWYCPTCKQHQQATKKLDLWSLPPVLVVHLKRFSYSRYMRDKLDSLVDFPLSDLDMSEFLINPNAGPCRYDLIAVSNHYGGMGGGHYTAYAKNKEDMKWYNFDDSSVSPANHDQIVSKAGYVLFYQRQDTVKGTGFFPLDCEEEEEQEEEQQEEEKEEEEEEEEEKEEEGGAHDRKSVASATAAAAPSDEEEEDLNENTCRKKDSGEEAVPSRDVAMRTN
uniref:Ubiquitin carboxyl-terminal hydrolase 15 n=1 Tax=Gadus morhua TaxID=8049 RepID=A0A8C4ZHR2_GADMO